MFTTLATHAGVAVVAFGLGWYACNKYAAKVKADLTNVANKV